VSGTRGGRRTVKMRLTLRFLVKSLIVLILLMFVLPLFLHRLDSQEWEKMEEIARAKRDRAVSMMCDNYAVSVFSEKLWFFKYT